MKVGDKVKVIANTHFHHMFPINSKGTIIVDRSLSDVIGGVYEVRVGNKTKTVHEKDIELIYWEQMELP